MATPTLMPSPRQRFVDNVGLPLANGMVFTFAAGTSDALPAFQDPDGLIPHENPIRLDIRGESTIYWLGNYKVDVRNSLGVQLPGYPVDNFNAIDTTAATSAGITAALAAFLASSGSSLVGWIQTGVGAVATTVLKKLRLAPPDVEDFGAVGNGIADDWAAITKALDAMSARGGNVTLRMNKRYRITKGLKMPANVFIEGPMPVGTPFNNATPAPAIIADFTDPNQWVIEPRTTNAGGAIPYNVMLTVAPDGFCFNVGIKNLLITSVGVTPYGGIRMHGCPGSFVEGVSILNTGIGLLINESYGSRFQVRTQTLYYGVIAWCEVNACSIDAYCTQADPKPKTVPTNYLFPGVSFLNGSMVNLGLSTEAHYNRPFGMVFGAQDGATASNNEVGFTSEYFDGGIFMYNAKSISFNRLYVEGAANEVSFAIVANNSSFSSDATHIFLSGTGTLFDVGAVTIVDLNLNGVISYEKFKPTGSMVPNSSRLVVRGVKMSGALFSPPEINVTFPDDGGDWIAPTLLNSWANAGGINAAVGYRLNPMSRDVEFKGVPIGGLENQPAFILPVGFRPMNRGSFPVIITSAASPLGNLTILASGEVIPATVGMSANGLDLRPARFRAEQ